MGMMLRRYHEAASSEVPPDDLDTRTKADLGGYAAEHGIDLAGAKTKADMVAAIRAHFAALPDAPDWEPCDKAVCTDADHSGCCDAEDITPA